MNPILISTFVTAALEIWRTHSNKPPGWTPTAEDWEAMRKLNTKSAEDYEREAVAARGETLGDVSASVFTDNAR